MITHYTRRRLTFESDSLRAFAGILHSFAESEEGVFNICGQPLVAKKVVTTAHGTCTTFADTTLMARTFFRGLTWRHSLWNGFATRRPTFPSWSWAGWEGEVQDFWNVTEPLHTNNKVCFENEHGTLRTLEDIASNSWKAIGKWQHAATLHLRDIHVVSFCEVSLSTARHPFSGAKDILSISLAEDTTASHDEPGKMVTVEGNHLQWKWHGRLEFSSDTTYSVAETIQLLESKVLELLIMGISGFKNEDLVCLVVENLPCGSARRVGTANLRSTDEPKLDESDITTLFPVRKSFRVI